MNQNKDELINELMDTFKSFKSSKQIHCIKSNLKQSEFMLVFKLDKFLTKRNETKAKTTELSKMLDLSPSTITPLINSLEERGYIKREYDKTDRRIVFVSFTKKGTQLKQEMNEEFTNQMEGLIDNLGENDTKELIRLLKKCTEYMHSKRSKFSEDSSKLVTEESQGE